MRELLFSGTAAFYQHDILFKEKLNTTCVHPTTGVKHNITISYRRNELVPESVENRLLDSPEYADWTAKTQLLETLYIPKLANTALWPTVTGFEFTTKQDGSIEWNIFEDESEAIKWMSLAEIPDDIPRVKACDITDEETLSGRVCHVILNGTRYALKQHSDSGQNDIFTKEVEVLLALRNVPHIIQLSAVVIDEGLDGKEYVRGILLPLYEKGDLRRVLREDAITEVSRKRRWAAQIAHATMLIQSAGFMHGDLRCQNVVIDGFDNAAVIDIIDGRGWSEGWSSIQWDGRADPRRDIYGLGVVIWEIMHDGEEPVGKNIVSSMNQNISDDLKVLISECVSQNAAERPSLAEVHLRLGGSECCGCAS